MQPSSPLSRAALTVAALLAVVAVLAVVAGGALGRGVDPSPSPTSPPSDAPTAEPTAPASPEPTAKPSDDPTDGGIAVDLDNLTGHDVSLVIDDETGAVVDARSGTPGDGMSVRWFDVEVENVDDTTLRITWVGLPGDEVIRLAISGTNRSYALDLFQAAPPADSDAVGFDRVLFLNFASPVSAEEIEATFHQAAIPA